MSDHVTIFFEKIKFVGFYYYTFHRFTRFYMCVRVRARVCIQTQRTTGNERESESMGRANRVTDKLLYWRMCLSRFTRCSFIANSYLQKP